MDMIGKRFSMLTVVRQAGVTRNNKRVWYCECECGGVAAAVTTGALRGGNTRSCGCFAQAQRRISKNRTHGMKWSSEWASWQSMKSRCLNTSHSAYANYGGRGIRICPEWVGSFEAFYRDMGPKPTPRHSIDRYPDMNGNYEQGNCRWADPTQQSRNRRNCLRIVIQGEVRCLAEWCSLFGVPTSTAHQRLNRGLPLMSVFATSCR